MTKATRVAKIERMKSSSYIFALALTACSSQGETPPAEPKPVTKAAAAPEAAACQMVVAVTGMS